MVKMIIIFVTVCYSVDLDLDFFSLRSKICSILTKFLDLRKRFESIGGRFSLIENKRTYVLRVIRILSKIYQISRSDYIKVFFLNCQLT